nr:MAG TPA: hypothetical protein [Caudoviricetes sp.]
MLSTIFLTEAFIFIFTSMLYTFVLIKEDMVQKYYDRLRAMVITSLVLVVLTPFYILYASTFFINVGISILGLMDFIVFGLLADTLWRK